MDGCTVTPHPPLTSPPPHTPLLFPPHTRPARLGGTGDTPIPLTLASVPGLHPGRGCQFAPPPPRYTHTVRLKLHGPRGGGGNSPAVCTWAVGHRRRSRTLPKAHGPCPNSLPTHAPPPHTRGPCPQLHHSPHPPLPGGHAHPPGRPHPGRRRGPPVGILARQRRGSVP